MNDRLICSLPSWHLNRERAFGGKGWKAEKDEWATEQDTDLVAVWGGDQREKRWWVQRDLGGAALSLRTCTCLELHRNVTGN